jgi:hypothetical protein
MDKRETSLERISARHRRRHTRDVIAMPTAQMDAHCSMFNSERPQKVHHKHFIIILFCFQRRKRIMSGMIKGIMRANCYLVVHTVSR